MLITAGIGRFTPRSLPAGEGWVGRGLEFFVLSFQAYAGKEVIVVGGGDSACDWALHLEPHARSVALVHRRESFRAHQRTIDQLNDSTVEIITKAQVTKLVGEETLSTVEITFDDGTAITRNAQAVVAALGFVADLGVLRTWGLETDSRSKRHIVVDSAMRTNMPRVFSAGDVTPARSDSSPSASAKPRPQSTTPPSPSTPTLKSSQATPPKQPETGAHGESAVERGQAARRQLDRLLSRHSRRSPRTPPVPRCDSTGLDRFATARHADVVSAPGAVKWLSAQHHRGRSRTTADPGPYDGQASVGATILFSHVLRKPQFSCRSPSPLP